MVRPSYVLGGRAMEIVYNDKDLKRYIQNAVEVRVTPSFSPFVNVASAISVNVAGEALPSCLSFFLR